MDITQLFTVLTAALGMALMVVVAVVPTWLRYEAETGGAGHERCDATRAVPAAGPSASPARIPAAA